MSYPDSYLIGNAITRECPFCGSGPGVLCVNPISKTDSKVPHIVRMGQS